MYVCVCVRACVRVFVYHEALSSFFLFVMIILYSYFSHMIDMDVIHNLRTHN